MNTYDDDVRDATGRPLDGPDKHMRILERRKKYLDRRIERAKDEGKELMYDAYERDALDWAIRELEQDH